uniref:hypothetical protein n=1 Tax=Prevotella sp. TaxID=59823 RepID=UPI00402666A8
MSTQHEQQASSEHSASIKHRASSQQASSKQPVSDLYPCGRIPQNAALLLAKTSDGPSTIE